MNDHLQLRSELGLLRREPLVDEAVDHGAIDEPFTDRAHRAVVAARVDDRAEEPLRDEPLLREAQALARHKSVATTCRYFDRAGELQAEATASLGSLLVGV